MAVKVLGQVAPTATTDTDLYTVPAGKVAVCSSLVCCNSGGADIAYRVAVRPAGAALAAEHYLLYDVVLPAHSSDFLTVGITLAASDVITVYVDTATVSLSLFGDES